MLRLHTMDEPALCKINTSPTENQICFSLSCRRINLRSNTSLVITFIRLGVCMGKKPRILSKCLSWVFYVDFHEFVKHLFKVYWVPRVKGLKWKKHVSYTHVMGLIKRKVPYDKFNEASFVISYFSCSLAIYTGSLFPLHDLVHPIYTKHVTFS